MPHLLTVFRITRPDGEVIVERRCNWCSHREAAK